MITIIVMLILVAVTVNVAMSGGLFGTANKASQDTEKHAIYDKIVGAMKLTENGAVDVNETYEAVKSLFGEENVTSIDPIDETQINDYTKSITFSVEGKKGTYTYKITTNKIIINDKEQDEDMQALIRYFIGEDEQNPRNLSTDVNGGSCMGENGFVDDLETAEVDESTIIYINERAVDYFTYNRMVCYIQYNNKTYSIYLECFYENEEDEEAVPNIFCREIDLVYSPDENSKVGKYVEYDGHDWVVLYDDEINGLQMVAIDKIKEYKLGRNDAIIGEENIADLNGNGDLEEEKAIYSYNNAIKTLNDECKKIVTKNDEIIESVRSLGSNPTKPYEDEDKIKKYEYKFENSLNNEALKPYNKQLNETNNNLEDFERIIGANIANIVYEKNGYFRAWSASRIIAENNVEISAEVGTIGFVTREDNGFYFANLSSDNLFYWEPDKKKIETSEQSNWLCPVVTLKKGILDTDWFIGKGSKEEPYEFNESKMGYVSFEPGESIGKVKLRKEITKIEEGANDAVVTLVNTSNGREIRPFIVDISDDTGNPVEYADYVITINAQNDSGDYILYAYTFEPYENLTDIQDMDGVNFPEKGWYIFTDQKSRTEFTLHKMTDEELDSTIFDGYIVKSNPNETPTGYENKMFKDTFIVCE